jgi:alpha,alpha-trehalase
VQGINRIFLVSLWKQSDTQLQTLRQIIGFWSLRFDSMMKNRVLTTILPFLICSTLSAQRLDRPIRVPVQSTLAELLEDEDTDSDKKITIDDPHIIGTERGDKRFRITAREGRGYEVSGTYYLSNLLQELKLAEEAGKDTAMLEPEKIFELPVERISRMIREYYWNGLTRRIDEDGILAILSDEKTRTIDGYKYLYVPADDRLTFEYFARIAASHPETKMKVVFLAKEITAEYVRQLNGFHGLLPLALRPVPTKKDALEGVPFIVPGGRFNEMYGWDSYFITLGLLADGRFKLARAMVENFIYEIIHYGAILNANRTYYLTRSQPPFMTSMVRAVYDSLPKGDERKGWLLRALGAAVREYQNVWMNKSRLTQTGLSRYFDSGREVPPEVEPGHFAAVFAAYARKRGMDPPAFEAEYRSGKLSVPELDEYFVHDRCMRESGHDTSYRLEGRCANLVTVDLNSLLYKYENDLADLIESEFGGRMQLEDGRIETSAQWRDRAKRRRDLVNQYLWNPERGMYFDYDFVRGEQTGYESATTFYPLWAKLASPEQARAVMSEALPLLETPGGIVSTTEKSRGPVTAEHPLRQWDFPHGWAPHQMIAWQAAINYGFADVAARLSYKWLYTVTINATHYNGTIPEKFDVVRRTHQVFAEYGNVGTKFAYITREGFGWTNASYQLGLEYLSKENRSRLNRLIPPEWIFPGEH